MRALLYVFAALAMPGLSFAAESAKPGAEAMTYECPVPAGFEAEASRRMGGWTSQPLDAPAKTGWYATDLPAALSANYSAASPATLDLQDTPIYVGKFPAGPGYGDRIDRWMICGHSIETYRWAALVEAFGVGYATLDLREALADQPIPTEEGDHAIAPHSFRFAIGDVDYQLVVIGVSVGLQKVFRPDLAKMKGLMGEVPAGAPDSTDPEAIWPVLQSFTGLLFASAVPRTTLGHHAVELGASRDPVAMGPATMGNRPGGGMISFSTEHREQPVDVSATPNYITRVFGAPRKQFPDVEYRDGFAVQLDGETLIVSREGGGSVDVDLGAWFDRQSGETAGDQALITSPELAFDLDGTSYKLVVTLFMTSVSTGADGQLVYEGYRISADLFASAPV